MIIAKVSHPIPFRTRPLNPFALMVLRLKARESKSSPDLPNTLSFHPSFNAPVQMPGLFFTLKSDPYHPLKYISSAPTGTRHPQTNSGHPLGHAAPIGTVILKLAPDIQVKPYSLINPLDPRVYSSLALGPEDDKEKKLHFAQVRGGHRKETSLKLEPIQQKTSSALIRTEDARFINIQT